MFVALSVKWVLRKRVLKTCPRMTTAEKESSSLYSASTSIKLLAVLNVCSKP